MYDLYSTIGLPKPRLQFVWVEHPTIEGIWFYHYQLVLHLQGFDIRMEEPGSMHGEHVVELEPPTMRSSNQIPCKLGDGSFCADLPFRSGRNSLWDSNQLGNLPVYVRAPNDAWLYAGIKC